MNDVENGEGEILNPVEMAYKLGMKMGRQLTRAEIYPEIKSDRWFFQTTYELENEFKELNDKFNHGKI